MNTFEKREDRFRLQTEVVVAHDPRYGAAFQGWLEQQLEGFSRPADRSIAFDVGAHEGEFFRALTETPLISGLVLFEPHPDNAERLRQTFQKAGVTIEEVAVAATSGTVEFQYGDDTATGSLLPPKGFTPAATQSKAITTTSLDDYASKHGMLNRVNILKVDTQGADLQVLMGAETLLAESQPILIVEIIFAQLYENQGSPAELISWLSNHGYQLVGLFDEHFSNEGWLAWCDACFLPESRMTSHLPPFNIRRDIPKAPSDEPLPPGPEKQEISRFQKLVAKAVGLRVDE